MAVSITAGSFPYPPLWSGALGYPPANATGLAYQLQTLNSTSEAVAYIGRVYFNGSPASKIISGAGLGQIMFRTGTNTWQALSILGIGIQALTTGVPVRPSETFLTSTTTTASGGIALPGTSWITVTMANGIATLTNGQLYAVVFNMSSRISTDSIQIASLQKGAAVNQSGMEFPMSVLRDGGAWTNTGGNSIAPILMLRADDGTLGWLSGSMAGASSITAVSLSNGTANTEVGMTMTLPWTSEIDGFGVTVRQGASLADFTALIYSDPNGTPVTLTSFAVQGLQNITTGAMCRHMFPMQPTTITASTTYALVVRADTNSVISLQMAMFSSVELKEGVVGWGTCSRASRGGGAGAFSLISTDVPPNFYMNVHAISGGTTVTVTTTTTITTTLGMRVHPGMGGGARG